MSNIPIASGLMKVHHQYYGNILVATKPFKPGDVVVKETPVMATNEEGPLVDDVYDYLSLHGITAMVDGRDASLEFSMHLLEFCNSDASTQAVVLEMFTPCILGCSYRGYIDASTAYASHLAELQRTAPEEFSHSVMSPAGAIVQQQELVVQVLMTWTCNCYGWDDGGAAILYHGSLVTHSCWENTRFRFLEEEDGNTAGIFLAVRDIQPGDMLTTNYLGYDEYRMLSTCMRQHVLQQTKMFQCDCPRCIQQLDFYRAMPCPACHAPYLTPPTVVDLTTTELHSDISCAPSGPEVDNAMNVGPDGSKLGQEVSKPAITLLQPVAPAMDDSASTAPDDPANPATQASSAQGHNQQIAIQDVDPQNPYFLTFTTTCCSQLMYPDVADADCSCSPVHHDTPSDGHTSYIKQLRSRHRGGAAQCVQHQSLSGGQAGGFVYCDMSRETAHHPHPWLCDSCEASFATADIKKQVEARAAMLQPYGLTSSPSNASSSPRAVVAGRTDLEHHLEERVYNFVNMLNTCVPITALETELLLRQMLYVFGPRHWTTNSIRFALVDFYTEALTQVCHRYLDSYFSGHVEEQSPGTASPPLCSPHHPAQLSTEEEGDSTAGAHTASTTQAASSCDAQQEPSSGLQLQRSGMVKEASMLVLKLCGALQAVWHFLDCHAPDPPEVVLKSSAGPAATTLLAAVEAGLCNSDTLRGRALEVARHAAICLASRYAEQPWYDISGSAAPEARRVAERAACLLAEHDMQA